MVGLAGALVLNIGTLSPPWVEAMLAAGRAANARGIPVVLDPVGAGATRYRTETAKRLLDEVDVDRPARQRGRGRDARRRGGGGARRRVDRRRAAILRSSRARRRGRSELVASVTGPVDHVSDGVRTLSVANGHELLATVTGTGCMSSAITGCFLAANPSALEAAAEALAAFGVAGEDAAVGAQGPGDLPRRALRRALRADSGVARRTGEDHVRLHALVEDLETAREAVAGGATVVQLRVKGASTAELVELGRPLRELDAMFVVNDDVRPRSGSKPTASISAATTRAPSVRSRRGSGSASPRGTSGEAIAAERAGRGVHRRRADLGDAVEGGRRPADRARRARRDRRRGRDPRRRDRRDRRDERRCVHRGGRGRGRRDPGRARRARASRGDR